MQSVKEFVICCRHGVNLCDQESVYKLIYVVVTLITLGRRQSKTPILSRNVDQKSLETEFTIAICGHAGDKCYKNTVSIDF